MASNDNKQRAEVVVVCWAIWRARNDLVWNQKFSTPNRVVAAAKQFLTQWKLSQSRSNVALNQPQVEGDGASSWVRPQTNSVKVSTDAAIFEDRESVGFGLVARDSEGGLLEAKALVHHELLSPMLALSWIDRMQWNNVTLESDCLAVVQAIRSKAPMRARFGGVIKECRELFR
ncbi:uncharacterized protein LOC141679517 [Apium graveolens]|uniref:uncharacterized protein LOC141679517 n=1 Tax=Apium graveolens TaxID=4045 RepID=UPI003D7B9150